MKFEVMEIGICVRVSITSWKRRSQRADVNDLAVDIGTMEFDETHYEDINFSRATSMLIYSLSAITIFQRNPHFSSVPYAGLAGPGYQSKLCGRQ